MSGSVASESDWSWNSLTESWVRFSRSEHRWHDQEGNTIYQEQLSPSFHDTSQRLRPAQIERHSTLGPASEDIDNDEDDGEDEGLNTPQQVLPTQQPRSETPSRNARPAEPQARRSTNVVPHSSSHQSLAARNEWRWDTSHRRWIFYSSERGQWFDQRLNPVAPVSIGPQRAGVSSTDSRVATGDPQRLPKPTFDTEDIKQALPSVHRSQTPDMRLQDLGRIASPHLSPGQRTFTAQDQTTGISTPWEVVSKGQYTNPQDPSQKTFFSLKRIGKSDQQQEEIKPGRNVSKRPDEDYQEGNVIQFRFVPPPNTEFSTISAFTQDSGTSTGAPPLTRIRRFIVVKNRPEGRAAFRAVAIKTYNGEGVGQHGVIKSHHSQCYSGREVPRTRSREHPRRLGSGEFETGMQPRAIRVTSFDRTRKLDDMTRIHYVDEWEFDYQAEHIRVFGVVHKDSLAAFFLQYQNVWQSIRAAARGPSPSLDASRLQTERLRIHARPPSTAATGGARLAHEGGPSSGDVDDLSHGHVESGAASSRQPTSSQHPPPTAGHTEPITVQRMQSILQSIQRHAREHNLPEPAKTITDRQLEALASNGQLRQRYLEDLVGRLRQAMSRTEEESRSSASGSASVSESSER